MDIMNRTSRFYFPPPRIGFPCLSLRCQRYHDMIHWQGAWLSYTFSKTRRVPPSYVVINTCSIVDRSAIGIVPHDKNNNLPTNAACAISNILRIVKCVVGLVSRIQLLHVCCYVLRALAVLSAGAKTIYT